MYCLLLQLFVLFLWLTIRHWLYVQYESFNINELHHFDFFILNVMTVQYFFINIYIGIFLLLFVNIIAIDDIRQHAINKSYLKKIAEKFDYYNEYWKK